MANLTPKSKDPSQWFTDIMQQAELADIRYNIKGFLVYQPWAVDTMEIMYDFIEADLNERGHKKYWFPALIPEKNFNIESDHVEGFTPQVFWVESAGADKLEERYALRPTSETAFYSMFSLWLRSYKDLPFRTYQRANVFRYETKATRPFLRTREFFWIETHCAFPDEVSAFQNILDDLKSTEKIIGNVFGIPTITFKRPKWDTFAGADSTYAADAVLFNGKVIQLPSTHMLGTNFSKPFGVKFQDKDEQEKFAYLTCYGPCVSRIYAAMVLTHGDDKGMKLPFELAPTQVIIVPILAEKEPKVLVEAKKIAEELKKNGIRVQIDSSDKRAGEKFYFWEMKGVPIRIELGPKDLEAKKVVLVRRDEGKKKDVSIEHLGTIASKNNFVEEIKKEGLLLSKALKDSAITAFKNMIVDAKTLPEIKKLISTNIIRTPFCSAGHEGAECAQIVEKDLGSTIRGTRIDVKEKPAHSDKCPFCGKEANEIVYIAKQY
jgi:prolyl-tRNA synthetase